MESTDVLNYPAAHSMDTTWFAVDAEGSIAIFDTGEGGAVPEVLDPGGGGWVLFKIDWYYRH